MERPANTTTTTTKNRYLDVMAVPKRHVLEQLALLAWNEEEREKLLELASPEGADLYHEVCQCGGVRGWKGGCRMTPRISMPHPASGTQYCYREKRPLIEVLQDFPSTRRALQSQPARFLSICPRIRPRAFSIASSPHPDGPHPRQLHLCVAVVSFRTPYKRCAYTHIPDASTCMVN